MPILHSSRSRPACSRICLLLFVAVLYHDIALAEDAGNPSPPPQKLLDTLTIVSEESKYRFQVEIADTPEDQRKGLMYRDNLPKDRGMLFVFDKSRVRSFWMKNTHIALDMFFIGKDGTIRHIHHSATPNSRKHISSQVPAHAVLEINGGLARKYGIDKGDTVHHAVFGNAIAQ